MSDIHVVLIDDRLVVLTDKKTPRSKLRPAIRQVNILRDTYRNAPKNLLAKLEEIHDIIGPICKIFPNKEELDDFWNDVVRPVALANHRAVGVNSCQIGCGEDSITFVEWWWDR